MCFIHVWNCNYMCAFSLCLSQWMCVWTTVCMPECASVAGQLPGAILICQCNSLPSLIFNKAPRELRTSSSELSVCYWLLNKAHSVWRAGPGERKQPECSCHESCQFLWTNGQFFRDSDFETQRSDGQRALPRFWASTGRSEQVWCLKKD